MQTELLQLKQKQAESVQLLYNIRKYVSKQYGEKFCISIDNDLSKVEQMRKELLNLQEGTEGSRDHLYKYYAYSQYIAAHFPINSGTNRITLDFSWYDSFTRRRVSQGNIYYEQANVLFNAAVVSAQLGYTELRQTAESAKSASLHFQVAGGVFQFIKDSLIPLIPEKVTVDLTGDCLDALVLLMTAQAQQCVYENAVAKKMKNSNLAKLAYDCCDLFENVGKAMVAPNCAEDFDKYTLGHVQFKQCFYEALAHYHVSMDLHENTECGAEISRLKGAKVVLDKTKAFWLTSGLKSSLVSLTELIDRSLKIAETENQKIYHERIPALENLPPLEKFRLAKLTPLKEIEKEFQISDPFGLLVPVNVLEAKGRYAEQLAQRVVPAFRNARQNREKILGDLNKYGLPGAILQAEKKSGFPDQIHTKVSQIQQIGSVNRLIELKKTLDELSEETRKNCLEVVGILDKEEKEDKECRDQYGVRWTRMASYQLNGSLRKHIEDYKAKVELAQKSDQLVSTKISSSQGLFKLFGMTKLQLDSTMPKSDHEDSIEASKIFGDVKKSLADLDSLFEKENEIDRQVKNLMETEQVEKEFILKQQNLDKAITEQVGVYEIKFLTPLSQLHGSEQQLCQQIVTSYQQLLQMKGTNSHSAREKVVQEAFASINKYDEITANISEGIRFYTTLQDYVRKERNKVEDFVFARRTEKQDLISNLQMQVTGVPQQESFVYQQYQPSNNYYPQGQQQPQFHQQPQQYQQGFGQPQQQQWNGQYQQPNHQQFPPKPQEHMQHQYNLKK